MNRVSLLKNKTQLRKKPVDFPGGPVVKNPLANARGMDLIRGQGKIPHAKGQLSQCALLSLHSQLLSLHVTTNEAHML